MLYFLGASFIPDLVGDEIRHSVEGVCEFLGEFFCIFSVYSNDFH